jgi:hypothetical protein
MLCGVSNLTGEPFGSTPCGIARAGHVRAEYPGIEQIAEPAIG